jgi:DNA-binding transcriptional ArsR family regulator
MLEQRLTRILTIVLGVGPINTREIGRKLGSQNHLTQDLALLKSKGLVKMSVVSNQHVYKITRRGFRTLRESKTSAVSQDLSELQKILSGRLVVQGNQRFELREDGTVERLIIRNADGSVWVRDQRTEEEKKRQRDQV